MLERTYLILLRDIGRGSEEGGVLGLESGPKDIGGLMVRSRPMK